MRTVSTPFDTKLKNIGQAIHRFAKKLRARTTLGVCGLRIALFQRARQLIGFNEVQIPHAQARHDGTRGDVVAERSVSSDKCYRFRASFISRIWQPRSTNGAGDAAVNFGTTVAIDVGLNVLREFWPDFTRHVKKH
jgi:hypothetical protein